MNPLFASVTDFLGKYSVLLLLFALLLVNFIGACVVLFDKRRSRAPRGSVRRVPEKCFVRFAAFGGGAGVLLAMLLARHKNRLPDGFVDGGMDFSAGAKSGVLIDSTCKMPS